jgi:hypothetical protein
MLKKTITYTDYDGNSRTEDFYFNLTKTEIIEMELSVDGGISKMIEKLVATHDQKRIMDMFKELVLKAYGEKSPDGRRFIKTDDLRDSFAQTEAYNLFFMELATDTDAAITFVNGIVPQDLAIADPDQLKLA